MRLFLTLALCLGTVAFIQANEAETYKVQIEEKGMRLEEEVEIKGDVHIYRVPAHNDLLAATFVLDYKKGLKVWHVPALKICYATTLRHPKPEEGQQKASLRKFQKSLLHASKAQEYFIGYISSPKPLQDRSFLPHEAQEMCKGLPVTWTNAVTLKGKGKQTILLKADKEHIKHFNNAAKNVRRQRRTSSTCDVKDLQQACQPSTGTDNCFYITVCGVLKSNGECTEHVRNMNLNCTICCLSPWYTKATNVKLQHCDNITGGKATTLVINLPTTAPPVRTTKPPVRTTKPPVLTTRPTVRTTKPPASTGKPSAFRTLQAKRPPCNC